MNYAIIDFQGHQYPVKEGDELVVDRLKEKEGKEIKIDRVLFLKDGEKLEVGAPLVKNALVAAKVLENFKGEKIRVATYKAKARYRRVKGFRPLLTKIKIVKIGKGSGRKPVKKVKVKKK